MKRIISLILAITIIVLSLFSVASCANVPETPSSDETPGGDIPGGGGGSTPEPEPEPDGGEPSVPTIIKPDFTSDGRESVNFSNVAYVRPDVDAMCADFDGVTEKIRLNAEDFGFTKQMEAIIALEEHYVSFTTMRALAEYNNYRDTSDSFWAAEYNYVSTMAPKLSHSIEALYVAAAQSPFAENFEREYFGPGFIEEYADGGSYTDTLVALLAAEADYISQYHALSPDTVEITVSGVKNSYRWHLDRLEQKYARGEITSDYYSYYLSSYEALYNTARGNATSDIYVELLKVRRLIADELGKDSYLDIAYEDRGYDYTPEEYLEFAERVVEYISPVQERLYLYEFAPFFSLYRAQIIDTVTLMNSAYPVLGKIDPEFANIYAYMLSLELYDVGMPSSTRYPGAFTVYIQGNESPFLFVTRDGSILDYSTLFHEFGHFIDMYENGGALPSLELTETCSQGLEYISSLYLKETLTANSYKYLRYSLLVDAFDTLISQTMYALLEHYAYELSYDDITKENLDALAQRALSEMLAENDAYKINPESITAGMLLVPHLIFAPAYVQSYSTSIIPALEMYIDECTEEGSGILEYKAIIYRDYDLGFIGNITDIGLTSPFEDDALKNIADGIYYLVVGTHFFTPGADTDNAA